MPQYIVKVTCTYPVEAVNAEDALSTVPVAVRITLPTAESLAEILNVSTNQVVLKAKLGSTKE